MKAGPDCACLKTDLGMTKSPTSKSQSIKEMDMDLDFGFVDLITHIVIVKQ